MDKKTAKVICTNFSRGKTHDFRVYKESKIHVHKDKEIKVDSGYQGIQKLHSKTTLPNKKTKKMTLTTEQKKHNKKLASDRILNENVIGVLKRFRIIADKYRNRRKRFGLRFNLIAGFYNFELSLS